MDSRAYIAINKDTQNEPSCLTAVSNCVCYTLTNKIRYKNKLISNFYGVETIEYRLQQMHQGNDGTEKWEWVEYI